MAKGALLGPLSRVRDYPVCMSQSPEALYGPDDIQAPAPVPKGPGLIDQIIGVFTAPGDLFDRLRKTPAWVAPYLFIASLSSAFTITWVFRLDWLAFIADQAEKAGKPQQAIPESALGFIRAMGTIQMLVLSFGMMLIIGLILWGLGRWLSEEKASVSFRHAMAALVAPSLVKLPALLLGIITVATREVDIQTPEKLIPTSLGFFVHPENPKIQALLHHLDPFAVAYGVLGYLALRRILKLPVPAAVGLLVIYNLLVTLLPILQAK